MPERRQHPRHTASLEVWGQALSAAGTADTSAGSIRGTTRNVSDGGLCVAWNATPDPSAVLRCRVVVAGTPAAIPTLAQVCWIRPDGGGSVTGLSFLVQ